MRSLPATADVSILERMNQMSKRFFLLNSVLIVIVFLCNGCSSRNSLHNTTQWSFVVEKMVAAAQNIDAKSTFAYAKFRYDLVDSSIQDIEFRFESSLTNICLNLKSNNVEISERCPHSTKIDEEDRTASNILLSSDIVSAENAFTIAESNLKFFIENEKPDEASSLLVFQTKSEQSAVGYNTDMAWYVMFRSHNKEGVVVIDAITAKVLDITTRDRF